MARGRKAGGIRFSTQKLDKGDRLRGAFQVWEKRLQAEVRAVVKEVAWLGAEQMLDIVQSNPRPTSKYPDLGRYEHGPYQESIDVDVSGNANWGRAVFGHIDNMEPYFKYQERGFRHHNSGKWIPGTQAFATSWELAKDLLVSELKRITS